MLVEGVSEGERVAAVIGVGLNLVRRADAGDLAGAATSLRAETGRDSRRGAGAWPGLVWYDAVARGDAQAVVEAFTARALPWWGRPVSALRRDGAAWDGPRMAACCWSWTTAPRPPSGEKPRQVRLR